MVLSFRRRRPEVSLAYREIDLTSRRGLGGLSGTWSFPIELIPESEIQWSLGGARAKGITNRAKGAFIALQEGINGLGGSIGVDGDLWTATLAGAKAAASRLLDMLQNQDFNRSFWSNFPGRSNEYYDYLRETKWATGIGNIAIRAAILASMFSTATSIGPSPSPSSDGSTSSIGPGYTGTSPTAWAPTDAPRSGKLAIALGVGALVALLAVAEGKGKKRR